MKLSAVTLIALFSITACSHPETPSQTNGSAASPAPQCLFAGTRSEGWYLDGKLLRYEFCKNKILACKFHGTRSEGWYSYLPTDVKLIAWNQCGNQSSTTPTCVNQGTRSEGWQWNSELIFANCANLEPVCMYKGTRSEGWYSAIPAELNLVRWTRCAL